MKGFKMKKLFMIAAAIAISANVYANEPKFHALKDAKGASQMYNHKSMFGTSGRHDEAHLPAYRGLHIGMTKAAVREKLGEFPQWTSGFRANKWEYNTHFEVDGKHNVCQVHLDFKKGVVEKMYFRNVAEDKISTEVDVCAKDKEREVVKEVIVREVVSVPIEFKVRQ